GFGVAVAPAAVADAELAEAGSEAAAGESRGVVSAGRQGGGVDPASGGGADEEVDRLLGAGGQLGRPGDDLAGVTVDRRLQVAPAMRGDPDRAEIQVPELIGSLDPEETGTAPPTGRAVSLQQALLAHHPLRPLAVHRPAKLAARERGDHPGA